MFFLIDYHAVFIFVNTNFFREYWEQQLKFQAQHLSVLQHMPRFRLDKVFNNIIQNSQND